MDQKFLATPSKAKKKRVKSKLEGGIRPSVIREGIPQGKKKSNQKKAGGTQKGEESPLVGRKQGLILGTGGGLRKRKVWGF